MTENFRPVAPAELVVCLPPAGSLPRRTIPTVAGLIAFEATARHKSFSQAALELALSQGAVSKRVRQLEQVLGVTLLARTRHDVRLTETGRGYLANVRGVLEQLEATTQALFAGGKDHRALALGVPRAIATYWLLPRLADFHAIHPEVVVNLVAQGGTADLSWDRLDAAIVEEQDAGHQGSVIFDEVLVPVAHPAVAARLLPMGVTGLSRGPLLHYSRKPDLWWRWLDAAGSAASGPLPGPACDSRALVLDAALLGHGVALAPWQLVSADVASGRLVRLFDIGMPTGRRFVFRIARGRDANRAVLQFADWLEGIARTDR